MKIPHPETPAADSRERREFFRSGLRGLVLGGLGLLAGRLLLKRRSDRSAHLCINEGICRGCRVFRGCILPQALSAKKTLDARKGTPG